MTYHERICLWMAQKSRENMKPMERVFIVIQQTFNVSRETLVSKKKSDNLVEARYAFIYIAMNQFGLNSVEIGAALNRDHSTVLYGYKAFENRLAQDLNGINEKLNSLYQYL